MLFRLLGFAFRVVGSFFFVFLLQFQFDGRTFESYLNDFGKKFVVTKTLKSVSEDGAKVIKSVFKKETEKEKKQKREIANQKNKKHFKSFLDRINAPSNQPENSKE